MVTSSFDRGGSRKATLSVYIRFHVWSSKKSDTSDAPEVGYLTPIDQGENTMFDGNLRSHGSVENGITPRSVSWQIGFVFYSHD